MITRPTTDQLLEDVCRELIEEILPALTDETLQVRVAMAETVLRNAAVRAAHEIAWMTDEAAALTGYARDVAGQLPDPALAASLADVDTAPPGLHLADVVEAYDRAGRAFTEALAAAQRAGAAELVAAGRELLRNRVETEKVIMANYGVVGR
ncbi:MAG TPA: hypothetical protein VFU35_13465 [Jatrophihabitans sp.]|nr:hypothetical protein [Jatrophihabitans sp.]